MEFKNLYATPDNFLQLGEKIYSRVVNNLKFINDNRDMKVTCVADDGSKCDVVSISDVTRRNECYYFNGATAVDLWEICYNNEYMMMVIYPYNEENPNAQISTNGTKLIVQCCDAQHFIKLLDNMSAETPVIAYKAHDITLNVGELVPYTQVQNNMRNINVDAAMILLGNSVTLYNDKGEQYLVLSKNVRINTKEHIKCVIDNNENIRKMLSNHPDAIRFLDCNVACDNYAYDDIVNMVVKQIENREMIIGDRIKEIRENHDINSPIPFILSGSFQIEQDKMITLSLLKTMIQSGIVIKNIDDIITDARLAIMGVDSFGVRRSLRYDNICGNLSKWSALVSDVSDVAYIDISKFDPALYYTGGCYMSNSPWSSYSPIFDSEEYGDVISLNDIYDSNNITAVLILGSVFIRKEELKRLLGGVETISKFITEYIDKKNVNKDANGMSSSAMMDAIMGNKQYVRVIERMQTLCKVIDEFDSDDISMINLEAKVLEKVPSIFAMSDITVIGVIRVLKGISSKDEKVVNMTKEALLKITGIEY